MMLGMDMMGGGRRLPRAGLLIYLARPNSDEYLVGEDTEIGEDTYIWGYVLPDDADIRAATGWVSGTANVFYGSTGTPIVALATEIAAAVLPANVVFSLVDATTQTGKLAVYTATTTAATLAKARTILRDESINYLFYGRTAIAYDHQDLATMFQDAAGTLPVYRPGSGAVDPPVGLLLDKSLGLELGPELVGTVEAKGTAGYTKYDAGLNRWECHRDANGYGGLGLNPPHKPLTPYILTLKTFIHRDYPGYTKYVNGAGLLNAASISGAAYIEGGLASLILITNATAVSQISNLLGLPNVNCAFGVEILSVREIKGYHAYQSTPTARPTLSGRYNLLTATETLSTQSVTTTATTYTFRFEGTGTVTLSGAATGTYSAGTHTITCTAGSLTLTVAGSVTKADLRVKRAGSSLPPYQRVDDANTYDTTGFPLYLRRDRVDDDLIVQAQAITGLRAWGSIDTVDVAAVTISAGEYQPFGTISEGEPTCTQWIAIDGTLTAAEQAVLERYVYSKSKLTVGV